MTHLYIKICDLCGKACEAGSQMHAGNIHTDIIVKTGKRVSTLIFREEFDICIDCLNNTGLYEILKKMQEQKYSNKNTENMTKRLVEDSQKKLK